MTDVVLDGKSLGTLSLARIGAGARATLSLDARARIQATADWYAARGRTADAPSPAQSSLAEKWTWLTGSPPAPGQDLVRSFIVGHCAGVGAPLPREVVRASMAARANVLATGATGCRPVCVDVLLAMLTADVV